MDRNKSAWGQGPKAASVTTNGAGRGGDVLKRQPKDSITQNMARKPSSDGNVGQRRGKSDFSEEVCCLPLFNSMVTAAQRLAAISIGLGHQRRGTSAPRSFFSPHPLAFPHALLYSWCPAECTAAFSHHICCDVMRHMYRCAEFCPTDMVFCTLFSKTSQPRVVQAVLHNEARYQQINTRAEDEGRASGC